MNKRHLKGDKLSTEGRYYDALQTPHDESGLKHDMHVKLYHTLIKAINHIFIHDKIEVGMREDFLRIVFRFVCVLDTLRVRAVLLLCVTYCDVITLRHVAKLTGRNRN